MQKLQKPKMQNFQKMQILH